MEHKHGENPKLVRQRNIMCGNCGRRAGVEYVKGDRPKVFLHTDCKHPEQCATEFCEGITQDRGAESPS